MSASLSPSPLGRFVPAALLTHAYWIATTKEVNNAKKLRGFEILRKQLPQLELLCARPMVMNQDPPSAKFTPRVWWNIARGARDASMDIATLGAVGCADSHIHALELCSTQGMRANPNGWSLIFESDANPSAQGLGALAGDVPMDTFEEDATVGMIVLGFGGKRAKMHSIPHRPSSAMGLPASPWFGTHALLVRNRLAQAMIDALLPLDAQYDAALSILACLHRGPAIWAVRTNAYWSTLSISSSTQTNWSFKAALPSDNTAMLSIVLVPALCFLVALIVVATILGARTKNCGTEKAQSKGK
jgi:hypothetical protein